MVQEIQRKLQESWVIETTEIDNFKEEEMTYSITCHT